MATSYSQLKTDIADWLNNQSSELQTSLDRIVSLGETRLARDLKVPQYDAVTPDATFAAGSPLLDLPADLTTVRFVRWRTAAGPWALLEFKDLPFLLEYWPDPAATGAPRYYGRYDDTRFLVAPTPSEAFAVQIGYTRRLPALSADAPTNWLTEAAEDALLYACLIEAAAFALDPQQVQTYKDFYAQAVGAINGTAARTLRDDVRTAPVVTANA